MNRTDLMNQWLRRLDEFLDINEEFPEYKTRSVRRGKRLTHDQTRYIFETNTIGVEKEVLNVDDVIETANRFRCIDMIIENAKTALTEKFIKELHLILKNGTSDSRKERSNEGNKFILFTFIVQYEFH